MSYFPSWKLKTEGIIAPDERLPTGQTLALGIQHVVAMFGSTILAPLLMGFDPNVAILMSGIGTLIFFLVVGGHVPSYLGSSFAFIGVVIAATGYTAGSGLNANISVALGGIIICGLIYAIVGLIVMSTGVRWIEKLMPPVVIGPTVALIGLSLAGSAVTNITTAAGDTVNGSYNLIALLCGLVTFFTVVICSGQKRFKTMKLIPFIIGIGAGYVVAAIFTAFGLGFDVDYLKIVDFSPLVNNFVDAEGSFVGVTAFLNYPDFALIEGIKEIINGASNVTYKNAAGETMQAVLLNGQGVAEVALAFIPVALVVFAEHIADHKNLSSIIGRDLVEGEPGLKRTLLGDGVGSIAGTVLGICPNTTYGESVGCVAITGNASVRTILVTAIMCIVLSFLSPIMALLQTIPAAVMGGVCFTLYGFIAVSGLKMFKDIDLGENKNLFVVSAILIAGIGGLAIQIPYQLDGSGLVTKTITVTSIATALILGIVTYAVMNKIEKSKLGEGEEEASVPSAAVEASVQPVLNETPADETDITPEASEEPAAETASTEETETPDKEE